VHDSLESVVPWTAASTSASLNTMKGAFPPASRDNLVPVNTVDATRIANNLLLKSG
jgi:hypothetical protein